MVIRLFAPTYDVDSCLGEIRECFEVGWTGMGYKTERFEDLWRQRTGLRNAFFVNSCTAALYLAVNCLKETRGWRDGDEIISTPNTFVSTNHMILANGMRPVFADIDDTFCLDPDDVERRIGGRTRAVMYVGVGGNAGHYRRVADLCRRHGLALILDASHMAGTRVDGRPVGGDADAVCWSFQAVKNLPTADSGMVCFAQDELDRMARRKAWLGIDKDTYARTEGQSYKWQYDVGEVGYKLHGNAVIAAIAIAQLPRLEPGNARRRAIAGIYDDMLGPLARDGRLRLAAIPPDCLSSRHLYQIVVGDRDALWEHLRDHGIESGVHYVSNTRYAMYRHAAGTCPRAEYLSDHVLSLPMHLRLTDDDARYVARTVIEGIGSAMPESRKG